MKKTKCCKSYRKEKACKDCPVWTTLRTVYHDVKRSDVRGMKLENKKPGQYDYMRSLT